MQDLNLRPLQCECSALTTELIARLIYIIILGWKIKSGVLKGATAKEQNNLLEGSAIIAEQALMETLAVTNVQFMAFRATEDEKFRGGPTWFCIFPDTNSYATIDQ